MKKRTMENRIALSIVTVVFLVLGGAVLVINYVLSANHQKSMDEEIRSGREGVLIAVTERKRRAELIADFMASEAAVSREGIGAITDDEIRQAVTETGLSYLGLVNRDGVIETQFEKLSSGSEISVRDNEPVFLSALFGEAVSGKKASGFELCYPDKICVSAYAPVMKGGAPVGYVRAGFIIDDGFAKEVSSVSGADYLLLRNGRLIAASIIPGTLSDEDVESLGATIAHFQKSSGGLNDVMKVRLRKREFVFDASEIAEPGGAALAVRVIARDTEGLKKARLESIKLLGLLTVVGLLLSLALGRFFARGIFGPLNNLLENVLTIAGGKEYPRLNVRRTDEIGELARAFDEMSDAISTREAGLVRATDEIKKNQDQIIRSGRLAAVGELAAGVAHEIGNPLSAVSGYAQLIERNSGDPEKVKKFAEQIEKETEFIEKIIQDLLNFSKPSQDKKESADIADIVESTVRTASSHKAFGQISLVIKIDEDLPKIICDRKEITQALLNLLINAAQEAPPQTVVEISVKEENDSIIVSVTDSGRGVSAEAAEKIFNPFFTTKSAMDGTGLGLSVCFRILEKHGGKIWFENLEKGVRFSMSIPVTPGGE